MIFFPWAGMASTLVDRLRGQVLLQVEQHGEAWYVNPRNGLRYYLRDGSAAYQIMRQLGLGISNRDLQSFLNGNVTLRARLRGYILLQVENHGEAYYLCPRTGVITYIRDGAIAYQILRACGLGITDSNLAQIPVGSLSTSDQPPSPPLISSNSSAPKVGACQIYPSNNPWNQDISALSVNAKSSTYLNSIGLTKTLHPDFGETPEYGIPFNIVDTSQPKVPITFTAYGSESDPGPYPVPSNAKAEAASDRHVLVLDQVACKLYELFDAAKSGSGWAAAGGAVFDLKSNALRPDTWTSADAAGLPIYPGLVKYDEVASGSINHAIRFSTPRTQNGFIHPATHQAGSNDTSLPPMGLRLRLKANYDISKYTGQARVILEAMKKYGLILADNGSSWFFQGAYDPRWNDDELNQLKQVPGSAFEAVETGQIIKP